MRYRNQLVSESIAELEDKVGRNTVELDKINRSYDDDYDEYDNAGSQDAQLINVTDDDVDRELQEIRELERKKRSLEDRNNGLERDLGGLLR